MIRICNGLSWLLTSLGAALLICSILLVPTQRAFADILLASCPSTCSTTTCTGGNNNGGCSSSLGACKQDTDSNCANCGCSDPDGTGCKCRGVGGLQS